MRAHSRLRRVQAGEAGQRCWCVLLASACGDPSILVACLLLTHAGLRRRRPSGWRNVSQIAVTLLIATSILQV